MSEGLEGIVAAETVLSEVDGANGVLIVRGLSLDDVMVLSPTSVLNVRYGITQEEAPERRRSQGFDNSTLGFSPSLLSLLDKKLQTFPNVFLNTTFSNTPCTGPCWMRLSLPR